MIVEVDIGNTRLKWRLRGVTAVNALPLERWSEAIDSWLEPQVHKIIVSCVAGVRLKAAFTAECVARLNLRPEFIVVQDGLRGLKLGYHDTTTLGVDRWLAMLCARHNQSDVDLIVVSAGSAITVDYVRADGEHLGGLIMPGVAMSSQALEVGAAQLGQYRATVGAADLGNDFNVGVSTEGCIIAGLSLLYRGVMAQLIASCPFESRPYSLVLAGGDSEMLLSMCPEAALACIKPNLVLDGLSLIN